MARANFAAFICPLALMVATASHAKTIATDGDGGAQTAEVGSPKAGTVNISGTIRNNAGQDICGLVLANGAFTFSCSPSGRYSLTSVPFDANNQVTLFGFAEGHFPFKAVLDGSVGRYDIVLTIAAPPQPTNPNRDKSALLIGGTWTFSYVIVSTFSDQFAFRSIDNSPNTSGDYVVAGTGPGGRPAVGEYVSAQNQWAVLWQGTLIDEFFTFTFSGNNNVSGCYYQISPPGTTNLSRCYSM
ncbi:MAG TPA: hypothetical protein VF038_01795, partial [Usitatibacter sp.]